MRSEDRELVERMQAGDPEAVGAGDGCQDVFVEVSRSIRSFEGRSAFGTWILGIANHEVSNRHRRRRRQPQWVDGEAGTAAIEAREAPIDRQVDAARTLARCADVLAHEVGAAHRQIFELQLGGARDVASIAAAVGKSRQGVKISLFRTPEHLHDRVAGLGDLLTPA